MSDVFHVTASRLVLPRPWNDFNHRCRSPKRSWTTYTGPWPLPDGTYTLYHRSKDKAGSLEDTRSAAFKIDTKPPAITITQPAATNYPHSSTITLDYAADDGPAAGLGAGSGVASVTATLNGASTLNGHGLASGQPINLLTELSNGAHTFKALSGILISPTAARIMADDATYLIP